MPLAGWFLVQDRGHGLGFVVLAGVLGAAGNTIGSIVAYYIGDLGGRPLLERYGRFVLITAHDLDRADGFFRRRGPIAVFLSRVLPVIRTFISFPAGIARMRFGLFVALTFAGSFLWSFALALAGYLLGKDWERIRNVMRPFDYPIGAVILIGIGWFIWNHIRRGRQHVASPATGSLTSANGSSTSPRDRGERERTRPKGGTPPAESHPVFGGLHPPTRYGIRRNGEADATERSEETDRSPRPPV